MNQQIRLARPMRGITPARRRLDTANLWMTAESRSKHWGEWFISLA
jgi:hypothetical protein